jgi:hypothetical protein
MLLLPLSLPSGDRQGEASNTIALAEDVEIRDVSGSFEISIHTTRPQASIIASQVERQRSPIVEQAPCSLHGY